MSRPKVYLAGIISGLTYKEANDWRWGAKKQLEFYGIIGASPMRWKDNLSDEDDLHCLGYEGNVMSNQRGITTRDRWDVATSDLIIANLLDAKKVSIGTVMEIAWADLLRKPIIAVMEPENIHEHAMLLTCVNYKVGTIDEAIEVARRILTY